MLLQVCCSCKKYLALLVPHVSVVDGGPIVACELPGFAVDDEAWPSLSAPGSPMNSQKVDHVPPSSATPAFQGHSPNALDAFGQIGC